MAARMPRNRAAMIDSGWEPNSGLSFSHTIVATSRIIGRPRAHVQRRIGARVAQQAVEADPDRDHERRERRGTRRLPASARIWTYALCRVGPRSSVRGKSVSAITPSHRCRSSSLSSGDCTSSGERCQPTPVIGWWANSRSPGVRHQEPVRAAAGAELLGAGKVHRPQGRRHREPHDDHDHETVGRDQRRLRVRPPSPDVRQAVDPERDDQCGRGAERARHEQAGGADDEHGDAKRAPLRYRPVDREDHHPDGDEAGRVRLP